MTGLDDLVGRRVAVWGLGREGTGVTELLRARGKEPILVDDEPGAALTGVAGQTAGSKVLVPSAVDWSAVDVVVRAPGVSRYRRELLAAEASGARVTTAMALWLADFADSPVLAVTGTKGKSTTAALAAAVLRAGGLRVALLGNIGVPVTEAYDHPAADAYVVEVSSYQAVDATTTPPVAVLTSLAPDHVDWHGSTEAYYRDKLHLLAAGPQGPSGALAVSAASDLAVRRTASHPRRTLFGPRGRVAADRAGAVHADGVRLLDPGGLRAPGRHNLWNLCGAISGALLLTGRVPAAEAVAQAASSFSGLPSRCQVAGERSGLTFVDDALASNPFATVASLAVFDGRPLTLIAGGADRGVDMGPLAAALSARRPPPTVVLLGPGARCLRAALGAAAEAGRLAVRAVGSLEEAVALAAEETPAGGVVLFSPAQPTPAEEGHFEARSRRFLAAAGLRVPGTGTADPAPPTPPN